MKGKGILKIFLWIAAGLVGFVLILIVALQILLNSPVAGKIIDKLAVEFIDGSLEYSRLHVSLIGSFPNVRVTADTVFLTYPHERFSEFDPLCARSRMLQAGRGETVDTLAGFDRLTVCANPWRLLDGTIRVPEIELDRAKLYAHQYNDTSANWMLFRAAPEDTVKKKPLEALPWISVGEIRIADKPRVVYTNQKDTLFARLAFRNFSVSGDVKLEFAEKRFELRDFALRLDTLRVFSRLPKDTLGFTLDSLVITNPESRELELEAGARAAAFSGTAGRVRIPLWLKSSIRYDRLDGGVRFTVHPFDASLADVPLHLEGSVDLCDTLSLDAHLSIPGGDLSPLIQAYGPRFVPVLDQFPLNSHLSLDADMNGVIAGGKLPDLDGSFTLDVAADGAMVNMKASAQDVLWKNASYDVDVTGFADTQNLSALLPESLDLDPMGRVNIQVKASSNLPELKTFKFKKSKVFAKVESRMLSVDMPSDSIRAKVRGVRIVAGAGEKGLIIAAKMDTAGLSLGKTLVAATRGTKASYLVMKVPVEDQMVPKYAVKLDNELLMGRFGVHKMKADSLHAEYSVQKRIVGKSKRARMLDSLQRVYPSASRDSLLDIMRGGRKAPSELEIHEGDVSVRVDSSVVDLLNHWNPTGRFSLAKVSVSTPVLPLKTSLHGFEAGFDTKALTLDTLSIRCGTSDLRAKGRLTGMKRLLMGKSTRLKMDLDVDSDRLNLNELIYAFQNQPDVKAEEIESKTAYSSIQDSISTGTLERGTALILPSNVQAKINLNARRVDLIDFGIKDFNSEIQFKDRTLQLGDGFLTSDYGRMNLNAYYYTKSKEDIGLGVDLSIKDVSADGIIHMFKNIDTMMPALSSFEGNLNCDVAGMAKLDSCLYVIMPTIDGIIRISGTDLNISDAGDLKKITRLLRFKDKNIGHIDNMYVNAVIRDNELTVLPFEIGVDRYRIALDGTQGFDSSMQYHISVMKNPILPIPLGINIYGTTDKWKFSLCSPKYKSGNVPSFTRQLDGVQVNMGNTIKAVLKDGVDAAARQHAKDIDRLEASAASSALGAAADVYDSQTEQFAIETAILNQDEELDAAVEDALSSVVIDTRDLTAFVKEKTSRKELRKAEREARKKKV